MSFLVYQLSRTKPYVETGSIYSVQVTNNSSADYAFVLLATAKNPVSLTQPLETYGWMVGVVPGVKQTIVSTGIFAWDGDFSMCLGKNIPARTSQLDVITQIPTDLRQNNRANVTFSGTALTGAPELKSLATGDAGTATVTTDEKIPTSQSQLDAGLQYTTTLTLGTDRSSPAKASALGFQLLPNSTYQFPLEFTYRIFSEAVTYQPGKIVKQAKIDSSFEIQLDSSHEAHLDFGANNEFSNISG